MLPDELRPICQESGEPVDFIYNPFGVFSRMNLSQLLEITCAKPTWITDRLIKKDPKNAENYLKDLNETVIKHLGDSEYYDRINSMVEIMRNDNSVKEKFLESVYRNNLYVEVPSFAKINLRELLKTAKPAVNENVIIPKKLIDYMKQKTNCLKDLVINEDIILPKVFVGPIYVQKLYKIASKLITYRDFGPLKFVTQQPVRGRAAGGGGTFGGKILTKVKLKITQIWTLLRVKRLYKEDIVLTLCRWN